MAKQTQRHLRLIALLVLLGVLIWYRVPVGAWAAQEWGNARDSLARADTSYLVAAFCAFLSALLLGFHRWHVLLRAQELPVSLGDTVRLGFVGFVSSLFAPGSVTGDVLKAAFIAREQKRRTAAIATIIADRLLALYGLFLLASVMGIIFREEVWPLQRLRTILIIIWTIASIGTAGLIVLFVLPLPLELLNRMVARIPGIGRLMVELMRALEQFRNRRLSVAYAIVIGLVGHVGFVLSFYFCALALDGPTPPWQMHFVIIPVGMVLQAVPLAPGANLGVSEVIMSRLYVWLGPEYVKGLTVSLTQRAVTWLVGLVGLIWYIPLRQRMKRLQAEMKAAAAAAEAAPTRPVTTVVDPVPQESPA
ncbi:MAG TPA: lysylphosphatidylglycerol synthase transmembrane domain-containing protein [Gemmatales bacterium]|nr:lysylphosphatidylglycerol synthase transmembrane domain-containing protein [Gemmatales bacterium]HMP59578.1 lysylphosphatidylglycerol synthase transmembrane domain-containing protein [Gemmatales bacterium]